MDSGLGKGGVFYQTVDIEIRDSKAQDLYPYVIGRLDAFFVAVYTYYAEHGYGPYSAKLLVGRLNAALMYAGFYILTLGINWSTGELRAYWPAQGLNFFSFIFIGLCVYWLTTLKPTWHHYQMARRLRRLFREGLGLSDAILPYTDWATVVEGIHRLRREGKLPCLIRPL